MALFRKIPVIISAEQFGGHIDSGPMPTGVCLCLAKRGPGLGAPLPHVHTAHEDQTVVVVPGDWIVAEPLAAGKFYPIKDNVFRKTYEPVPVDSLPSTPNPKEK